MRNTKSELAFKVSSHLSETVPWNIYSTNLKIKDHITNIIWHCSWPIDQTYLTSVCLLNVTTAFHVAMAVQREHISYKVSKAIPAMLITWNSGTPLVSFEQHVWKLLKNYLFGTVRCRYKAVHFLPNPHKRYPIARPWGRGMGCLMWAQPLIQFCPSIDVNDIMLYWTA